MLQATSNFLIPNGTFIVELVAFLIILAVLGRKVLPAVNKVMTDRQNQIARELQAADEAKADAEAADEERRSMLEGARHQAREIVAQANRTAESLVTEARSQAQIEYDRIVTEAHAEIRLARQRAIDEAAASMGETVFGVVRQIVGHEVNAKTHEGLIAEAVAAVSEQAS